MAFGKVMRKFNTLRDALKDWQDDDVAMLHLAHAIGIVEDVAAVHNAKAVFWSKNSLGEFLYRLLQELKNEGLIESDEAESRYRWKQDFAWESKASAVK